MLKSSLEFGVWHSCIMVFFSLLAWRRLNLYLNSSSYLFVTGSRQANLEEFYSEKKNFSFLIKISSNYYKSIKDMIIAGFKDKTHFRQEITKENLCLNTRQTRCEKIKDSSMRIVRAMSHEEKSSRKEISAKFEKSVYKGKNEEEEGRCGCGCETGGKWGETLLYLL